MTMPASQPVDYVKWLQDFAIIRSGVEGGYPDARMLQSLADQLTALREAWIDADDYTLNMMSRVPGLIKAIDALTHTNPRDAHV